MPIIHYFANNWKYSNAPEGEEPFEKVIGLCKYGVAVGISVGIYDCAILSQTEAFWPAVNCVSYWVIPFTAMCATFASVAYTTTKLRGKDGYLNYCAASLATTGVFYQWQKKGRFAFAWGTMLMICATIKKYGDLNDWKPFSVEPVVPPRFRESPYALDFTLVKDPRGPRPWE